MLKQCTNTFFHIIQYALRLILHKFNINHNMFVMINENL